MASSEVVAAAEPASQRKRRRRRRQDKAAIAARLVLDDHVKTDVGILSEDLFEDLFPHLPDAPAVLHVAIAPWAPHHSPSTTRWTVVPVTRSSALAPSTVQFAPSALALQSFAAHLRRVAPSKLSPGHRGGIEVLVLDAAALGLDTVFVRLEGDLARRLEAGEGTFFRDHPPVTNGHGNGNGNGNGAGRGKAAASSAEERLTAALRIALSTLKVVHEGDLFPLPLAPHPVTHVPPGPGQVTLCEPVAQGVLVSSTRIIVSRGRTHSKRERNAASMTANNRGLNGVDEDEADDTANDQFYSAAEERYRTDVQTEDTASATETEESEVPGEEELEEEEEELSDDSMDDVISLQTPTLPTTAASGVSTLQTGTPLTLGRGRAKTNGISTPMSVYSSFTATTARPDRPRGRLFKAQSLAKPLPAEMLHPKPAPEDDEEARVYVDVRDLTRVGCFSGDWVRLESAEEPPANGLGAFGLGSFVSPTEEEPNWRPVRVFGLPEGYSHRHVTRIPSSRHEGRKLSFFESQMPRPSSPVVYLSPILLANMESSPYLRLSALKRATHPGKGPAAKLTGASQPPFAREVILQQVRTPVSTEREVQTAVIAGLKSYFAQKLRTLKSGDLIAVPIDTQLGRTLQEASASLGEESAIEQVLSLITPNRPSQSPPMYDEVAWFRVSHVQAIKQDGPEDAQDDGDTWGSVACVEISLAHLEQTGSVTSRVPGTMSSTWQYYLGLKKLPRKSPDSVPASPSLEPDRRYVSSLRRRIRELVAAATSKRAMHLQMPPVAILLVSTHRNIGKATTAKEACLDLGLHTFTIDAYDILNEAGAGGSDVKTEGFLMSRSERAMSCGPECCALLLRHIEALTADRMASSMREILAEARVLIATTSEVDKVPDGVRGLFTHELEMGAPDEGEREGILRTIVDDRGLVLDPEVDLGGVALKTAALVAGDLTDVVERALVAQQSRLEKLAAEASNNSDDIVVTVRDVQVAGGAAAYGLTKADFEVAVDAARKNFADAIGAPKIPNVTWADVGGLSHVKDAVRETIQLPLERPELFARGMKKRSGILFYGPPGTGKTLLAKAIATEYSLNFFSVKGPELLNMYIGESEANVRRVFARARDARPCVVFFDELDSVAPKRGNQGDSGGVMDRIVSQLLAELDGMSSSSGGGDDDDDSGARSGGGGVFVIGATNRPDLLDQALLRPGRFDKMLYLGVADTHDKQLTIMEALTRKFTLHPSVSLRSVAESLPYTYTGADFYALCSDAMLKAVTRQAAHVDAKIRALNSTSCQRTDPMTAITPTAMRHPHFPVSTAYFFDHFATPDDLAVMVTEQDFFDAHRELIPSVSAGELAHYERVRASFEGGRERPGQGQPPAPGAASRRTVSGQSRASTASKGKGKTVASKDVKGKGKVLTLDSDEEDGDADEGGDTYMNGGKGKGKGKGKAVGGFGNEGASDDEGLYE